MEGEGRRPSLTRNWKACYKTRCGTDVMDQQVRNNMKTCQQKVVRSPMRHLVFLHGNYYSHGAASRALNYLHNGHLLGQVGHLRQVTLAKWH